MDKQTYALLAGKIKKIGTVTTKAAVDDSDSLPATGNEAGDCRTAKDTGYQYLWDGEQWIHVNQGPGIDNTLTTSGKAADAKATGDSLAGKADKSTEINGKALSGDVTLTAEDLAYDNATTHTNGSVGKELASQSDRIGGLDGRVNVLHQLVDYGYADEDLIGDPTSSTSRLRVTVNRRGTKFTVNLPNTNGDLRVKVSGTIISGATNANVDAWTTGFSLVNGNKYRATLTFISGSVVSREGVNPPYISVFKVGTHGAMGTTSRVGNTYTRVFTATSDAVNLAIYIPAYNALTDAVYEVILEDITDGYDGKTLRTDVDTANNALPNVFRFLPADCESIPSNADLDDYTTPGNFKVTAATIAASLSHCPSSLAGRLTVFRTSEVDKHFQFYISNYSAYPVIYMRSKIGSSWCDWVKLIHDGMEEMQAFAEEGDSWGV